MTTKTKTTYHCDVCDAEIKLDDNQRLPSRNQGELKCHFDGEWAPVISLTWKHFCGGCRDGLIDALNSFIGLRGAA
ncbi:hypothetical protein HFO15_19955 [Rhizobium laguerreae]|uniref:hypothetical protein n=1 Tax=Rhizobium laguerreae TaxID=1076926 RepID=UPI001C913B27|nr:hypothetical protein [Rhizobium laguerreae]MBY3263902.1 hypothetical protein [Rhizobium laguerreae]